MKNAWIWIVVIVLVLVGGAIWWQNSKSSVQTYVETPEVETANTVPSVSESAGTTEVSVATAETEAAASDSAAQSTSYSKAQVASHGSAESCWSIVDEAVYDLTQWIKKHPGGERGILGICGKDGTAAFHGQHADAKMQADMLATMKIGVLAK